MPASNSGALAQARRQARIVAMQALCQFEAQGGDYMDELAGFLSESSSDPNVVLYARQLIHQTWLERGRYDRMIADASEHWQVDRMPSVDLNIMRIALCEMIGREDPPEKVAINEAIELAKAFGSNDSPQFVNGVLDAIRRKHQQS